MSGKKLIEPIVSFLGPKQTENLDSTSKFLYKSRNEVLATLVNLVEEFREKHGEEIHTLQSIVGSDGTAILKGCLSAGASGLSRSYDLQTGTDFPGIIEVLERFFGNNGDGNGMTKALRLLAELVVSNEKELLALQRHHGSDVATILKLCFASGIRSGVKGIEEAEKKEAEKKKLSWEADGETLVSC